MRARTSEFRLLPIGHPGLSAVVARSAHTFPRHTHDEFGIGLIARGGQMSASGRGQVTAGAGDIITVNPGEVHDGEPLRGEAREWHMLYLSPERMQEVSLGFEPAGAFEFTAPVYQNGELARTFAAAFSRLAETDVAQPELAADEALLKLFASLVRRTDRQAPDRLHTGLQRARARLDDDPASNHSLGGLAAEAGLSRFQLLRAFVSWTGLTPHAYLMQRRASHARNLIAAGHGLAAAAFQAGYADQSHMTRDFRRRYGLTPSAFAGSR
ncbi:MAG: AraC family transcriptional regulator [Rhizobium sp.]|nr:MAG: AraC family transcriptional regulator [Rhizobium sp.]